MCVNGCAGHGRSGGGAPLGIVWLRLYSELRTRWRTLLVMALFVGIGGGVALSAFAGARRADTAMSRFLTYYRPDDGGFIYGSASATIVPPGRAAYSLAPSGAAKEALALPQVESWFRSPYLFLTTSRTKSGAGVLNPFGAGSPALGHGVDRPFVVSGRLADPSRPFEATINELAAEKAHLHLGSRVRLYAFSYAQMSTGTLTGFTTISASRPAGPAYTVTVTGIVRFPTDVSAILPVAARQDVTYEGQESIYLTPAFLTRLASGLGVPVQAIPDMQFFGVKLRHGSADWNAFSTEATKLGHGLIFTGEGNTQGSFAAASSAQRGIHLEVIALLLFGGLALLVTILLVGQAVARQVVLDSNDHATMRSLGVTRGQLLGMVILRAGAIGLVGGAVAILGSFLASPLLPVGLARQAEIQPGFRFDASILVPGFFALVALICARSVIPAWRVGRRATVAADEGPARTRATRFAEAIARTAVPPSTAIGVSYGIDPGYGRSAVPVLSALIGSIVAVAALAASLTFATSLQHLISTPRQQGWNWDVLVGNPNDLNDSEARGATLLAHDRYVGSYSAIAIIAGASQGTVVIDGKTVDMALAIDPLKGGVHPPILQGHEPRAGDEIVLGTKTMEQLHKRIGEDVVIQGQGGNGNFRLRIVGTMIVPSIGDLFTNGVGDGAWVYGPALRQQAQAQAQAQATAATTGAGFTDPGQPEHASYRVQHLRRALCTGGLSGSRIRQPPA